jgi:ABC-type transport system involved in cytochrome c biogenesis permease subunit
MIGWNEFYLFGIAAVLLWMIGAALAIRQKHTGQEQLPANKYAVLFTAAAEVVLLTFIILLWINLERPPLRTMGETRLWYAFFMGIASLITYCKWKYPWILSFSTLLGGVFVALNIFKPEIHDQTLMPALQSIWFIPHVTIYMFSYSILGCAFIMAILSFKQITENKLKAIDGMVNTGISCLTIGMLLGSLWAKEAWGGYWNWDPKETWAAITWLGYLLYIHMRLGHNAEHAGAGIKNKLLLWIIITSFACLQMCWWGVNYLPAAKESIHTYIRQ